MDNINIKKLDIFLSQLMKDAKLRSKSMIMTIFGDVVSLYGGAVSLMNLAEITAIFDFNDRLTRTSMYRLTKQDMILKNKQGGRTYYSLSDKSQLLFNKTKSKVYSRIGDQEQEYWTLVYTGDISDKEKANEFEKELIYQGFAHLNRRTLFYPNPKSETHTIARLLGVSEEIIVFKSNLAKYNNQIFIKQVIEQRWNLDQIMEMYEWFFEQFQKILDYIEKHEITDQQALNIRLLLVHEYRKIILRNPILPKELLPPYWPDEKNYQLCCKIYSKIYNQTDSFLEREIFHMRSVEHSRFCL